MGDTPKKIRFTAYHKPSLHAGNITVTSRVTFNLAGINPPPSYSNTLHLFVSGPRFVLSPADIHAVFPPPAALGEFDNVLPHVELNVGTLPWQRFAGPEQETEDTPWLGLILLQADELAQIETVQLSWEKYMKQINHDGRSEDLALQPELSDHAQEDGKELPKIKVLQLQKSFAEQILPTAEELQDLTHIRKGHDQHGEEVERAVVVCNRMPRTGARAEVHLVSLEKRFDGEEKFIYPKNTEEKVPFVSLYSWQFSCPDTEQFKVSNKAIGRMGQALKAKVIPLFPEGEKRDTLYRGKEDFLASLTGFSAEEQQEMLKICHIQTETFKGLMDALDFKWVHLPVPTEFEDQDAVDKQFQIGSLPLAHGLRNGEKTASWYRGPLVADHRLSEALEEKVLAELPVRNADQLLLYSAGTQMLDTSYAAAWTLGRLLSLGDPAIAQQIAHWKTSHARELAVVEQQLVFSHIPFTDSEFIHQQEGLLQEKLQRFFTDLSHLKDIPFQYLVPHESYLPDESLRFFYVDPLWVECLLDGAFSIGRTTQYDQERDGHEETAFPHRSTRPQIMGVLLRSDLVSGWPSLMVEAYEQVYNSPKVIKAEDRLKMIRFERLGPNVLLVLFEGDMKTFCLHLPPESLHFGFVRPIAEGTPYKKELKDLNTGEELKVDEKNVTTDIVLKGEDSLKIVDIETMKADMNSKLDQQLKHAGHLAIELIEGVPMLMVQVQH